MKKFTSALKSNTAIYTYGIIFIFVLWFTISLAQGKGNVVFPNPIDTFAKTGELLSTSYIYQCIGWTLLRTIIGFGSSFILALILGLLAGHFDKLYTFLKPLIIVMKSAPTAAFIFLFLILLNTENAAVIIVFLISFPILYEAVVGGINNISKEIKDALKIDGSSVIRQLFKIKLPLAMPYIVVGVLSSFALSFKTTIMAEIISGNTEYGLGCAIQSYRAIDPTDLTPVFAVTLIAIVLILIVDIFAMIIKKTIKIEK